MGIMEPSIKIWILDVLMVILQDLRIYKGLAKYTQNFIPASTDPDILPDTPSGVAYSSNVALVPSTDGAVAFDGSGDQHQEEVIYRWVHFAAVRSGTSLKVYRDGKEIIDYNISTTTIYNSSANLLIGRLESNSNYDFNGFVSNFRLVKGTALYTSNFTPPSAPLTAVQNTKLLCCQSNTSAGAAAVSPNLGGINDGRVWSDASNLANPGLLFDGNDDTFVNSSDTSGGNLITSATQFTVPEGQTLTIRTQNGGASNISVNGSNVATSSGNVVTTLVTGGVGGTLVTSITAPTGFNLYYLKVNGVALMDPVAPIGNAAATNFNPFTVNINTQRGQESGYATWNPLQKGADITLSNGNLTASGGSEIDSVVATVGMSTGKWYWENTVITANNMQVGIGNTQIDTNWYIGGRPGSWSMHSNGNKYNSGSVTSYGSSYGTAGKVVSVAFDASVGELTFYVDGVSQGVAFSGLTNSPYYPAWSNTDAGAKIDTNFGQKPFKFPPPAGFQPLALANTPRPSIVRPDQYVGVTTYIGNGATSTAGTLARTLTGLTFKPDLIWVKERTATGTWADHNLTDSVRGTGLALRSNTTDTETNVATGFQQGGIGNGVNNGFTIISGNLGGTNNVNNSGSNYVAWTWKRSIESGFDIVTHTNTSDSTVINHNLGKTPEFIVTKAFGGTQWRAHHVYGGVSQTAILSTTETFVATAERVTAVSDTTFTYNATVSANGTDFIHYVWTSIPGFSKFGSYDGNENTDGTYVELGFRPALIWVKNIDTSGTHWVIVDKERDNTNPIGTKLAANLSNGDFLGGSFRAECDFLSNGFKMRGTSIDSSGMNRSNTYIYAAWAETPTFNLYGAQSNAR
jgi:hypothetical protein